MSSHPILGGGGGVGGWPLTLAKVEGMWLTSDPGQGGGGWPLILARGEVVDLWCCPPPPPPELENRCLWKHNLRSLRYGDGNQSRTHSSSKHTTLFALMVRASIATRCQHWWILTLRPRVQSEIPYLEGAQGWRRSLYCEVPCLGSPGLEALLL